MKEALPGRYPAVVMFYDKVTRTCRVDIPGITSGGDSLLLAELEYPLGDKSRIEEGKFPTEIEILPGDTVWVAFIGGDSRYPIITGYRNPQIGNDVNWRRWHHANIQQIADVNLNLFAGELMSFTVGETVITLTPDAITITTKDMSITSKLQITGSELTHNNVSVSSTHTHTDVQPGSGTTGVPSS